MSRISRMMVAAAMAMAGNSMPKSAGPRMRGEKYDRLWKHQKRHKQNRRKELAAK